MFLFIILLIQIVQPDDNTTVIEFNLVEILSSPCRCAQILSEKDCNELCFWEDNSDGKIGKCRDALCVDYKNATSCNSNPHKLCYYNTTTSSCEKLRGSCSDFSEVQCTVKDDICLWNSSNSSCSDLPAEPEVQVICIELQNEEICNNSKETNSGYFCAWNSTLNDTNARLLQTLTYNTHKESLTVPTPPGYCTRFPITQCSDIDALDTDDYTKKQLCNRNSDTCRYTSNQDQIINVGNQNVTKITYSCQQKTCGDYGTAKLCYENYRVPDFSKSLYLCSWDQNTSTCQNGIFIENYTWTDNKTKFFNQTNCYSNETLYQLTWDQNNSQCTKCPGFGQILSAFLAFYILIL